MDLDRVMGWLTDREDVSALLSSLLNGRGGPDAETLAALGSLRSDPVQAHALARRLRRALRDDDAGRRWRAAIALGPRGLDARELIPELLEALTSHRSRYEEVVAVVNLLGSWPVDASRLVAFTTTWIEALLREGSTGAALSRARDAAQAAAAGRWALPASPTTRGESELAGLEDLSFEPYGLRGLTSAAAHTLAALAQRRPALCAWLMEGTRLGTNAERGSFYEVLSQLTVPEEILIQGVEAVVGAAGDPPSKERLPTLRDLLVHSVDHPRWLVILLESLSSRPTVCTALGRSLYGGELGDPLSDPPPAWLASPSAQLAEGLEGLLTAPTPLIRVIAVDLLARRPLEADGLRSAIAGLLMTRLPQQLSRWVARSVVAAGLADPLQGEIRAALERGWGDSGAQAMLRAALNSGPATPAVTLLRDDRGYALLSWPVSPSGPVIPQGRGLCFAYQRAEIVTPQDEWRTDADQVGLALFDPAAPDDARLLPLPVRLPVRRTGGAGVKRTFELAARVGDELFAVLTTPFSDHRGWGSECRVFSVQPTTGQWRWWMAEGGRLSHPNPLDPSARLDEDSVEAVSFGELLVWVDDQGRVRLANDGTPYHLDDWEHSPAVDSALAAQASYQERLAWGRWEVDGAGGTEGLRPGDDLVIRRAGASLTLPGAGAFLGLAWPEAAGPGRMTALGAHLTADHAFALVVLRRWPRGGAHEDRALLCPVS